MNYVSAVRHPWPCLVFLVPLLAAYEVGVVWLGGSLRNGADVWLRYVMEWLGGASDLLAPAFILAILVAWTFWRWDDRPSHVIGVLFGMVLECILFAGFIWMIGRNFNGILEHFGVPLATQWDISQDSIGRLVTFIGAGIYEETVFRLILFAGLAWLLHFIMIPWILAMPMALIVSSILFALAHHVDPNTHPIDQKLFLFRATAGAIFALLFCWRGFGIAAGTHAMYDILVGMPSG